MNARALAPLFLASLVAAGCASAPPATTAPAPPPAAPAGLAPVASTALWAFHDHPWINLHHFLYEWARSDRDRLAGRSAEEIPERAGLDALSPDERGAWSAALDFYQREMVPRDLLFDQGMIELRTKVLALRGPDDPGFRDLPPGLAEALARAWPVYERTWWPAHDAANRRWIAAAVPLLTRFEGPLSSQVAAAYGGTWPAGPVRVDVSAHTNWAGAYTTNEPVHVLISSSGPGYQGFASLEMLLHETSHAGSLIGPVRDALGAAFAARGTQPPRDLWHALLFYTTGEVTRRALQENGLGDYTPFADRAGIYARGWSDYRRALERHWQPFLDGRVDRATALAGIAEELAAPQILPPGGP